MPHWDNDPTYAEWVEDLVRVTVSEIRTRKTPEHVAAMTSFTAVILIEPHLTRLFNLSNAEISEISSLVDAGVAASRTQGT